MLHARLEDKACQINIEKEVATQTKLSNYTNTPKCLEYIAGLRGRTDGNQVMVKMHVYEQQYGNK